MSELILNPAIIAALVSAFVTVLLFFIKGVAGSFWSKYFHTYKIRIDHEYEQRKKIKEAISKYKTPLLDSAEALNHRLWNFSGNCHKNWHVIGITEDIHDKYYLQSFCYRILAFLAWCKKFERESIYLDSTLSVEDDLYFVKYIKTMQNIFSDTAIFNGINYESEYATDHFFKDDLASMTEFMITETGVITFAEFKKKSKEEYSRMISYILSIIAGRSCNKWYLINCFHFILMAFLSRYGYDYQITERDKLEKLHSLQPMNQLAINLKEIIERGKLEQCKEIKIAVNVLLTGPCPHVA